MPHPRLLPLALAALLCLLAAASAGAVSITVGLSPIAGVEGCLRDPSATALTAACPGASVALGEPSALLVSRSGRSLYVAARGASGVLALARDPRSGHIGPARRPSYRSCLSTPAGVPCAARASGLEGVDALAQSPDGHFLYAGSADAATVVALARSATGLLSAVPTRRGQAGCVQGARLPDVPSRCATRIPGLAGVSALAASPDGRNLYAVSAGSAPGEDSLVALARDRAHGGLIALKGRGACVQSRPGRLCASTAPGLEGAEGLLISPDGRFLYVASAVSGAVDVLARDRRSGRVREIAGACVSQAGSASAIDDTPCALRAPELAGARALALSPDGRRLYVAALDPGAVITLARDPISGRLAPLPAPGGCLSATADPACPAPVALLRGASALALAPDGRTLYVACPAADTVLALPIGPSGAPLPPGSGPSAIGELSGPGALALSPDGRSLYAASAFDDALAGFSTG